MSLLKTSTSHPVPVYRGPVAEDLLAAAHQWRTEGWALVDGLVPEAEIDAVGGDLARLFAGDTFADYNRLTALGDGSPDGRRFRSTQFNGMRGFPQPGCPSLNDLFVHPRLIEFARLSLDDEDLRIYQAAVWGKWSGEVNYEQPLHQDGNHSLLPPRMEPGFWHLESSCTCPTSTRTARHLGWCRGAVLLSPTATFTSTRSPPSGAEARSWRTARTCGTAVPTSPGPTRPASCSRLVSGPHMPIGLAMTPSRGLAMTSPSNLLWSASHLRNSLYSASPGPDTLTGMRRPWTLWPPSTPGSTSRHGRQHWAERRRRAERIVGVRRALCLEVSIGDGRPSRP
jgi:hypothetical protein